MPQTNNYPRLKKYSYAEVDRLFKLVGNRAAGHNIDVRKKAMEISPARVRFFTHDNKACDVNLAETDVGCKIITGVEKKLGYPFFRRIDSTIAQTIMDAAEDTFNKTEFLAAIDLGKDVFFISEKKIRFFTSANEAMDVTLKDGVKFEPK